MTSCSRTGLRNVDIDPDLFDAAMGEPPTRHGHYKGGKYSPTAAAWRNILNSHEHDPEWKFLPKFIEDVGLKPKPTNEFQAKRIDATKPFSKDNFVWAGRKGKVRHRQSHIMATINGETFPVGTWCRKLKVLKSTMHYRMHVMGMTPEEALLKKRKPRKKKCLM